MAQLRVFVSHSSQDKPFADALVRALRQAGADVWYGEHNLGTGQLLGDIQRELAARPAFVVVLSKAAFASEWVRDECKWAYQLFKREPRRIILPVVAQPIERADFNAMLFLEEFRRVEAPSDKPYPQAEAIEHTLRLLELAPAGQAPTPIAPQPGTSVGDLIARGKALVAQRQYAQAIPFFEVATQLASGNFDAWFNLGVAHNLSEHWLKGASAWERALALDPNHAYAWNGRGEALIGLGRRQEALVALDRALALDSNFALAWNNKGNALHVLGRPEEALAAYDRALAIRPNEAVIWNNKGNALRVLKRYDEALEAYDRALAINPKDAQARRRKAFSLGMLTRKAKEALAAYERAMVLDPKYAIAWRNKGSLLNDLKRYEEALAAYDRALAINSKDALAWRNKAISLRAGAGGGGAGGGGTSQGAGRVGAPPLSSSSPLPAGRGPGVRTPGARGEDSPPVA